MPRTAPAKDPQQWPLDGQRILVVEDNAHTAALVRQALLAAGAAQVAVAANGRLAMAELAKFRPDVLVTDLRMPVVDGMELIGTVRQAALWPNADVPDPTIPIVMVSAFASRASVRAAQAAGVDAFVVKPFSLGSLVKRVDRAGRRTGEFVVSTSYVGPERRTRPAKGGKRRSDAAALPAAAQTLRLTGPAEVAPEAGSASQLKELYGRIQAMEVERAAAAD
jgi:two-component system chemotaxis response regulator CheY